MVRSVGTRTGEASAGQGSQGRDRYTRPVTERMPSPGPSFVREETVRLRAPSGRGPQIRLGMAAPSVMEDGWWLTPLGAEDAEGVLDARAVAPLAGPPPGPPLSTIGPSLAGALA